MLLSLSIRDFVLIERLELDFAGGGLMALTGETGAGKSILIDALGLALGARGDAAMVRQGATQASVTAVFELEARHEARAVLAELGIDDEATLTLRRTLASDGRGRAFVNDQASSVATLRRLADLLIEIQGQAEQQSLNEPALNRGILDAFGGLASDAGRVTAAWTAWQTARTRLEEATAAAQAARRDEDFLRHAVEELRRLAPRPGEEGELATERAVLREGGALGEAVAQAVAEFGRDRGVTQVLRLTHRQIERAAPKAGGRLDEVLAAVERALSEATEAEAQLEAAVGRVEFDPARLEKLEERLFGLRAAARKYGVGVDALADHFASLEAQLGRVEGGEAAMRDLTAQVAKARADYVTAAAAQSAGRGKAATRLDKAVNAELPPLKLEKAAFRTAIEALDETEWSAHGTDRVRFLVSTNPGATPGPIGRVASGGELSRFLLALKVALAGKGGADTLVFDEVDAGIGGATAAAVGERLRKLARARQILVVTHSPQVAAVADQHLLIRKTTKRNTATTDVVPLDAAGRREEIARMLAGSSVTSEARAAAERLMSAAG
ncbi:MAG: DNA repair protein RecN [Alphaproteobacteria bacterium]|nr:DNA repair protein RecN [Alphaproteobacteria bacterium]